MATTSEDPWPTDPHFYRKLAEKEWTDWESLFWRLYPWTLEWVRIRIRKGALARVDMADAEDVVVELRRRWPNVMKSFDLEKATHTDESLPGKTKAYIYKIYDNAYNSWYRSQLRHFTHIHSLQSDVESGAMTPPQAYDLIELREFISSLPEDERELLEMKFSEDLTFAKIADRLGIPPSRVYKLVRQLIRKLETRFG